MSYPIPMDIAESEDRAANELDAALDWPYSREVWDQIDAERLELMAANEALADKNSSLLATNYNLRKERDRLTDRLLEAERVCVQWCEWNEGLRNQLADANHLLSSGCTAYDDKRLGKWMQDVAVFLSRHAVSASGGA